MQQLLPVFTALSAIAFTVGYYSLYKTKPKSCCETPQQKSSTRLFKVFFWAGLLATIGFYSYASIPQVSSEENALAPASCTTAQASCSQSTEVIPLKATPSCTK